MNKKIIVIGGGLAGTEAAYQIAKQKINVDLYEMKPVRYSPAHTNKNLAEIVCSNSFKSNLLTNACGLLKEELRILGSLLIDVADKTQVPAGQALAVDRDEFSKEVTNAIESNPYINIIHKEVISKFDGTLSTNQEQNVENTTRETRKSNEAINENEALNQSESCYNENGEQTMENCVYFEDLIKDNIVIIATGPLTSDSLYEGIKHLIGDESLHFYDAEAPIIEKDSINFDIAFYGNRYDEEKKKDESVEEWKARIEKEDASYINLPMNKEEYENFCNELANAEVVNLHDFEKGEIFEGCMPVEIMCKRGIETLRFGMLKPVGFDDPRTAKRPYAVVQLRQDNKESTLYNIVGFQTNLKYGEQKRVFSIIPGLENAEFAKYGVMHRNTFINSSKLLTNTYKLKNSSGIYFAGQITGVEGYVESISSGMKASYSAMKQYYEMNQAEDNEQYNSVCDKLKPMNNENTMIGALSKYISTENKNFQPMNANYGILKPLDEQIKDKKQKYLKLSQRALECYKSKTFENFA